MLNSVVNSSATAKDTLLAPKQSSWSCSLLPRGIKLVGAGEAKLFSKMVKIYSEIWRPLLDFAEKLLVLEEQGCAMCQQDNVAS